MCHPGIPYPPAWSELDPVDLAVSGGGGGVLFIGRVGKCEGRIGGMVKLPTFEAEVESIYVVSCNKGLSSEINICCIYIYTLVARL